MIGGQTKTPTLSVLYQNKKQFLGGAAIVARHILASGAKVEFTTVVGKDLLGRETIKKLKEEKGNVPKNVTNALFVGSTTELQKLIKKNKDKK